MLAAACLVTAAAAGCSTDTAGPLSVGGGGRDEGRLCVPVPDDGDVLVGKTVTNAGKKSITLSDVSLNGSDALALEKSYATEMDSTDVAIGTGTTEAVRAGEDPIWRDRADPDSLILEPGDRANIVVSLSVDSGADEGSAEALEIRYTADGKDYMAESTTKVRLPREPC